jgi:hypothetical protein
MPDGQRRPPRQRGLEIEHASSSTLRDHERLVKFLESHEPYNDLSVDEVISRFERGEFPDVNLLACGRAIRGC